MDLILQSPNNLAIEMKISSALKYRRIYLSDEVERDTIFEVLYFLDRLRDIDRKMGTKEDIEIIIDSYGGTIYNGLSLISKVEQLRDEGYKIITTVSGVSMSMGFLILICSSERRAYRYSTLLAHQPSCWTGGTLKDLEDEVIELQRLWSLTKYLVLKYTKIPESKLDEVKEKKQDWILDAQKALELGVVDKIL